MIIIGFSDKTYRIGVRLFCGHFKHCVVITQNAGKLVLFQFVKRNCIKQIPITKRGIAQLESDGWVFIYLKQNPVNFNIHAWTCVNFVKTAIGLKKIWIQTPNALYKYLKKNLT